MASDEERAAIERVRAFDACCTERGHEALTIRTGPPRLARDDLRTVLSLASRCSEAERQRDGWTREWREKAEAAIRERDEARAELESVVRELSQRERKRAASICERMVVGGRQWTPEQRAAGEALLAAAQAIRGESNGEFPAPASSGEGGEAVLGRCLHLGFFAPRNGLSECIDCGAQIPAGAWDAARKPAPPPPTDTTGESGEGYEERVRKWRREYAGYDLTDDDGHPYERNGGDLAEQIRESLRDRNHHDLADAILDAIDARARLTEEKR